MNTKIKYILAFLIIFCTGAPALANKSHHVSEQQKNSGIKFLNEAREQNSRGDFENSMESLKKAAALENTKALMLLGLMYTYSSKSHQANTSLAYEYMIHAALHDDKEGMEAKEILPTFTLRGFGKASTSEILKLRTNYENKFNASHKSQEKIKIALNLFNSYAHVKKISFRNANKADYYLKELLTLPLTDNDKKILAYDTYAFALLYMSGIDGISKNPEKAFECMKITKNLGYRKAYYELSNMYRYGFGTQRDLNAADNLLMQIKHDLPPIDKNNPDTEYEDGPTFGPFFYTFTYLYSNRE